MPRRHPLPRLWLMTDERLGDRLLPAVVALPRGSGIVFRHHGTSAAERRLLFEAVRRIARARRLTLLVAGPPKLAIAWRADGSHGRSPHRSPRLGTAPAHGAREIVAARRSGKQAVVLSPVFATRSHPGARTLAPLRFGLLASRAGLPVLALGGMTSARARRLSSLGADGWAAIDALGGAAGQKRKAVPI